ncbi:Polyisoprenoid-binding protein YceI [Parapedobacter composti]|uniref:Polyisoprenoid-binding protein YceI n=1 Tax=Parapedobacter composti TaxID=623281 RepID=A0A1I1E8S6_9SPHI|nr:YceI family protein [Parapedobacter composti]SFB81718.1 Polyisoprenoid-binding protein YceI [Parapedobacter composti]
MTIKTTLSALFAMILLAVLPASARPTTDEFNVDTSKSTVAWTGQNIAGGKHTGTVGISKGTLVFEGEKLVGGTFTVDVNTIEVTDLAGDRATRLANHLKNEDFFDAPKFPDAVFRITKVEGAGDGFSIRGDLTIKGITKSIAFPAVVHHSGNTVHATAKGVKIDRTQFDIKYRSGNFFSGLGDRAISDEFQLDIEIFAAR